MSLASSAQNSYECKLLQNISAAIGLKQTTDTLTDGIYINKYKYNGNPISIVVDKGRVVHVGYSIFQEPIMLGISPRIRYFIERYMLESDVPLKRQKTFAKQMSEDEFHFISGNKQRLLSVFKTPSISIDITTNQRRQVITWKNKKNVVCSVSFPLIYELLSGTDLAECQNNLLRDLKELPQLSTIQTSEKEIPQLEKLFDPNYYVARGNQFMVEQLNSNMYYKQVGDEEYELIFSKHHSAESLANLFTSGQIDNTITLDLKLIMYDFKTQTVKVSLLAMLQYFKSRDCKTYYGVINKDENNITSEILFANQDEGYCHIIRLQSDNQSVANRSGIMYGRMNCYIPTSKIRMLFKDKVR